MCGIPLNAVQRGSRVDIDIDRKVKSNGVVGELGVAFCSMAYM